MSVNMLRIAAFLMLLFISAVAQEAIADTGSRRSSSYYFSDVSSVEIEASTNVYLDSWPSDRVFPFSKQDLAAMVADSIIKNLKTDKVAVAVRDLARGHGYAEGKEDENALQILAEFSYWPKARFSPEISHDIIVIQIKYKRNKEWVTGGGKKKSAPWEQMTPPMLLNVPEQPGKLSEKLQEEVGRIVSLDITSLLDCAYGQKC
ncbi:MAG: hypothetical protein ACAH80_10010 [Alphaproteobacteria bacterium]